MSWGRVACVPLVMASLLLNFQGDLIAQKFDSIDPVRVGDEIEYKWFSDWKPGSVVAYANGVATVEFEFGSSTQTRNWITANGFVDEAK